MTRQKAADRAAGEPSDASAASGSTLAPETAFKTIGNKTRLAILDVLWGPGPAEPMPFATIRKAVGMRDGSQFNYHLRKLVDGGFIKKDDDGYSLLQPGSRVITTIQVGYLTQHPVVEPFATTGRCYVCEGSLLAHYEDEMFFVRCADCEVLHHFGWFPPNALLARTPEAALLAHERVTKGVRELARAGICSICNGPLERTLARTWDEVPVHSPYLAESGAGALRAWYVCGHCGAWASITPGEAVLDHPAVLDLHRAHGVDLPSRPCWELPWLRDGSCLEVVSEDPFRVRVTVAVDDDVRVVTLDEAFDVVDVERS